MLKFQLKDFIGAKPREISLMLCSRKRCYATLSLADLVNQMSHRHQDQDVLIGGRFPGGASECLTWRTPEGIVYDVRA